MPTLNSRREVLQLGAGMLVGGICGSAESAEAVDADARREHPKLKITAVKAYRLRHHLKRPSGASVSVPLSADRCADLSRMLSELTDITFSVSGVTITATLALRDFRHASNETKLRSSIAD